MGTCTHFWAKKKRRTSPYAPRGLVRPTIVYGKPALGASLINDSYCSFTFPRYQFEERLSK